MPFSPPFPRSFTDSSVRKHAPTLSGVYGLSNSNQWVYVGETDNIQEALLRHLHELNTDLVNRKPTGFVFEVCDPTARLARQDRLVLEYEPLVNRHWAVQR